MRHGLALSSLALAVLVLPVRARAQQSDVQRAESLFNAAKALLESGQYVDACTKFAESKRLAPGLGVTLYLADCYERIGRTASAWTEFRSAEGLARERNDKRADVAHQRAQAIEPKLDRLTIAIAQTVPQAGLQILRDGVVVPPEEWGVPVPIDPGDHAVVLNSPGHKQRTLSVHFEAESASTTVHVDSLDEPASPPSKTPAPAKHEAAASTPTSTSTTAPTDASPSGDESSGDARRTLGIGVAAVGGASLVASTVFGIVALSKLHQSNDGPCSQNDQCSPEGLNLRSTAESMATASTITFVAGAVLVGGGAVLYFTAPRASSSSMGLVLAPVPGGSSGSLRVTF